MEPEQASNEDRRPHVTNVSLWRSLRNEARALALEATDPSVRETLMHIAAEYNRLAHQAEASRSASNESDKG
jgi:hypothetical protein